MALLCLVSVRCISSLFRLETRIKIINVMKNGGKSSALNGPKYKRKYNNICGTRKNSVTSHIIGITSHRYRIANGHVFMYIPTNRYFFSFYYHHLKQEKPWIGFSHIRFCPTIRTKQNNWCIGWKLKLTIIIIIWPWVNGKWWMANGAQVNCSQVSKYLSTDIRKWFPNFGCYKLVPSLIMAPNEIPYTRKLLRWFIHTFGYQMDKR